MPNANDFWKRFWCELNKKWEKEIYANDTKWTEIMLGTSPKTKGNRGLIGDIAHSLGFTEEAGETEISSGYYMIDQTWYRYIKFGDKQTWRLEAAIEHENSKDSEDYKYEIRKLFYINAPLRVVIGYPPNKQPSDEPISSETLSDLKFWLDDARACGFLNSDFLLILGHRSVWNQNIWHTYLLNKPHWQETVKKWELSSKE
jgi:hypothetical protein